MVLALDAEFGPAALAPAKAQIRTAVDAVGHSAVTNYSADIAGYRAAWNAGVVALGQR